MSPDETPTSRPTLPAAPGVDSTAMVDVVLRRRSVRTGFLPDAVDQHLVEQIVACGLASPSSKNARPARLHVVDDPRLLHRIADAVDAAPGIDTYVPHDPITGAPRPDWPSTVAESAQVLREVPLGIFVENAGVFSGGRSTLLALPPEVLAACLTGYTLEVLGVGASIQNMWIAANALGLQAVFMGDILIAEAAIAELLGARQDLAGVLAIGHAPAPEPPSRPHDLERVVFHRHEDSRIDSI